MFLLVLLTLGICEGDRHVGLRYYEDLYVKPLADGIVANHFTFTTQWDVSPEVLGHSANSGKIKNSYHFMRTVNVFTYGYKPLKVLT